MLDKNLIGDIEHWCRNFETTQPSNLLIYDDTFEGSAYNLFQAILAESRTEMLVNNTIKDVSKIKKQKSK